MPGGSGLTRGLVTTAAAVLLAGACGTTVNSRSLTGTGDGYYRYYDWNGSCGCMQYNGGNLVATGEGES